MTQEENPPNPWYLVLVGVVSFAVGLLVLAIIIIFLFALGVLSFP